MALLTPKEHVEMVRERMDMPSDLLQEVEAYCEYAGLPDKREFFEQAARYVLGKDAGWKKAKREKEKGD